MKTKYKHIFFVKNEEISQMISHDGRQYHQLWSCYNEIGRIVGYVIWYQYVRQYCIATTNNPVLSSDYLKEFDEFLEQLNKEIEQHESK